MTLPNKPIDQLLQTSRQPTVPVSVDAKTKMRAKWEQTMVSNTKPAVSDVLPWWRHWQWLLIPSAGIAAAVLVVLLQYQTPEPTQLANSTPVNQVIAQVNNNVTVTNTTVTNTATDVNPIQELDSTNNSNQTVVQPSQPLSPHLSSSAYNYIVGGLGGGSDTDYSVIQFSLPTQLPTFPATANNLRLVSLSTTDIKSMRTLFPNATNDNSDSLYSCANTVFSTQTKPCLVVLSNGWVQFTQAATAGDGLIDAKNYIAKLADTTTNDLHVEPVAESSVSGMKEYIIYQGSSRTTGLPYRDLGWNVLTEQGHLRSIAGYASATTATMNTVTLIPPDEALDRFTKGFAQPNASTNIQYARLTVAGDLTITILNQVDHPQIRLASITLEYVLADAQSGLAYIPVYYVRGFETTKHLPFETYIDATRDSNLFWTYAPKFRLP